MSDCANARRLPAAAYLRRAVELIRRPVGAAGLERRRQVALAAEEAAQESDRIGDVDAAVVVGARGQSSIDRGWGDV